MPVYGMRRQSKSAATAAIKSNTLVLDNGGYSIKAGFANSSPSPSDCQIIPNCIARDTYRKVWIGSQLEECQDFRDMAFRRPVDKGYLVNWEGEKSIWGHSFFSEKASLQCDPHEINLVLTEAPNCPQALQINCDQMIFEEFEFATYCRCLGPALNAYNDIASLFGDPSPPLDATHMPAECLLLIDSGYSHTTVTPLLNGRPVQQAIRRLDIGGKFLTNYLKEQLCVTSKFNLEDDTHTVSAIKERLCFVSDDHRRDIDRSRWKNWSPEYGTVDPNIVVDFVLPDYETNHKGIVRPHDAIAAKRNDLLGPRPGLHEQVVTLGMERFSPPELLFRPANIGMKAGGLPTVIMESIDVMPIGFRPAMLANILLVGGTVQLPGFQERLVKELRQLAPSESIVRITRAPDPIKSTWLGGARMASHRETLSEHVVTREEYLEHGASWAQRKFATVGG